MRLFIDTTNMYFITAIISNNKVILFEKRETNRNIVKNANKWLDDFLKNNKIKYTDFNGYFLTVGPGTFTGVKVGLNIIKGLLLVNPSNDINYINTLDLQQIKDVRYSILSHGKSSFYVKDYKKLFDKTKITKNIDNFRDNAVFDLRGINKFYLEEKLSSFKSVDNIDKIKLIYIKDKIG